MSGILKRKFEEVEAASSPCSSLRESDDEVSCSESGNSSDSINPSASGPFTPGSILKREKRVCTRRVHFEKVTVYYFSRRQGFTSVPSQGGSTLGMSNRHSWVKQYSLGEFAMEQERLHRDMLRDHLKEEKLNSIKLKLTKNGTVESEEANTLTAEDISDDDIDLDNTEVDEYFFLQPLTTKKRRALLRSSGVKKIDVEEKHELRAIRMSREDCGCDCRVFCEPETCACSNAGIKCQVDRMSFPCGCSKEGCSNSSGRVEFNPIRVRTHFLHTIMKLELEKSREQEQASTPNGYHGNDSTATNPLVLSQHRLDFTLSDAVPQSTGVHLQTSDEMEAPLEEDEDDDDDDDEEEEEEEEDEEEEENEDEEDSSSVFSGISDSSTQSLANSDSEEDEDEDEDEERSDTCHTEAPLASVLCYDNHMNGSTYLINSSPADYYQLGTSSSAPNGQSSQSGEAYGDTLAFPEPIGNPQTQQGVFPNQEQYSTHCNLSTNVSHYTTPEQDKPSQVDFADPSQNQTQFHNYLNNNVPFSPRGSCASSEPPPQPNVNINAHPDLSLLASSTKNLSLPAL
ncbi:cysteine/serine-rich nuclear protein 3 [Dunckerocampus dactyliophorus]|uniref:cysteine/serine-rich nuclear protein 3 n=1 Tax=Dunckerocampus dactyliophorus TaxID=161453 RepID=UPI0024057946|nr:cysteine/serine-rich nuclear protein 3 [Dunckerocampus dactyliophorus]XP_054643113.1 cysteine/serine-rich nuclear protein 3 [Dunckerocampus dactyliophorus]